MVIFGSAVVRERRNAKSATWIGAVQAMRLRIAADRLRAAAVRAAVRRRFERDVAELAVEIAVIRRAAEFAVGREPQPDALLQARSLPRSRRSSAAVSVAWSISPRAKRRRSVEQTCRPQQAADVLGAERWKRGG